MVNTSGPVNNTRNRENCLEAGFGILVLELSNRLLGFGESDVESDVRISNRLRPKSTKRQGLPQVQAGSASSTVRVCLK